MKFVYIKLNLVLIFLMILSVSFFAQSNYDVALIPAELKSNAKAIVRFDETIVEIQSINKVKVNRKLVLSVMNENGINSAFFQEFYDKFSRITNVSCIIFDANGKKIKRIPTDEIFDYSAISGFSAYDDNRQKLIDPKISNYPCTVEYNWEIIADNLRYIPNWSPYPDYNISVLSSKYKLIRPREITVRYLERNLNNSATISTADDLETILWEVSDLPALKQENFSRLFEDYAPNVILSPSEFEFAKTSGNAGSWNEIGDWVWELNNGLDVLPETTQQKITNLLADTKSDIEKIRILYQFLQNNTRYVSIQIGIGGFKPFDAATIDRLAYGDCKALTNYMYSMLKYAGIESYYTIVNAGKFNTNLIKEFPSIRFNHAFLCVPLENDTLWLECTSQTVPCGYLGTFTDDRDVLVIKEDGGHIVHTKVYSSNENIKSTMAIVELDSVGNGHAIINRKYKGQFYDEIERTINSDDADKKKQIYSSVKIPDFMIKSFKYNVEKSIIPVVTETLDLSLNNYTSLMGSNMLVTLNLISKTESLPKRSEDRKSDIYIPRAYTEVDTIIYKLPEGYNWNGTPENIELASDFGTYSFKTSKENNQIIYIRKLAINKGQYSKSNYSKLYEFFEKIAVNDQKKIAVKKTLQ